MKSARTGYAICAASFLLVVLVFFAERNDGASYRPIDHLGRPVSVETGTESDPLHNGFLQCAVNTLGPEFRHSATAEVFDELATKPDPSNIAVIVGHGITGMQCTGDGDNCPGTNDAIMMGDFNYSYWQPLANRIRNDFASLSLVGCEIGQGSAGAKFLYQMAQTIQRPVRGPDCIVFCGPDGLVFDDGGGWVEARPGEGPPPVHPPKRYMVRPTTQFEFDVDGKRTEVVSNVITVQRFEHRTIHQREFQQFPLETVTLLTFVDFGAPFETSGRPAAIITGRFHLQLKIGERRIERIFVLYNDVLLEDAEEQDVFYRVDRVRLSEYIIRVTR